jgi:hypothetical protein
MFQFGCDQPIVWVDTLKLPAGEFGFVTQAFQLLLLGMIGLLACVR